MHPPLCPSTPTHPSDPRHSVGSPVRPSASRSRRALKKKRGGGAPAAPTWSLLRSRRALETVQILCQWCVVSAQASAVPALGAVQEPEVTKDGAESDCKCCPYLELIQQQQGTGDGAVEQGEEGVAESGVAQEQREGGAAREGPKGCAPPPTASSSRGPAAPGTTLSDCTPHKHPRYTPHSSLK